MSTETANQPARLTAIELENFKGVGERVRLDLKPITLLFGANSAGKSTILQALQYVREVLERRNANPDRTIYGGDFIDLGGFRNLVHQRDLSRRIGVKLELTLNDAVIPDLTPEPWEDWQADLSGNPEDVWRFHETLQETTNIALSVSVRIEIGWSALRQAAVVLGYEAGVNGEWLARIAATEDGRDASIRFNSFNPIFIRQRSNEEMEQLRSLRAELDGWIRNVDIGDNSPTPSAKDAEDEQAVESADLTTSLPGSQDRYTIFPEILTVARDAGLDKPGEGLRSWLTGFDSALPHFGDLLSIPATGTGGAGSANVYMRRDFTAFLSSLVIGPGVLVRDSLRTLRYLGPIRNVPRRDFDAALTPDEARWADGLAAWECLMTGDELLVQRVSNWMSAPAKLGTGYEVERRHVAEVDVNVIEVLRSMINDPGHFTGLSRELDGLPSRCRLDLVEARTGLRVQPRDVGIGISQVLPVVVAALQPSAGLVAIEQPELHIHPAVQVGLGDLFARAVTDNGSAFLIETHSEHLILRLLRRIRETTNGDLPPDLPKLSSGQVGVIYVERDEAGVKLTSLPVDAGGEFTSRWPQGFFNEREHEFFGGLSADIDEQATKLFPK